MSALFRPATRIIAVSNAVRNNLSKPARRRAKVVYNGFAAGAPTASGKQEKLTFMIASRWNSWKGHEFILRVWAKKHRTDAILWIAGGPPPVGRASDVRALVEKSGCRDSIEIVGEQADLHQLLSLTDVVLVPSSRQTTSDDCHRSGGGWATRVGKPIGDAGNNHRS